PILSGFLATGNAWQGAVLQMFNLIVVVIIWWPFLKLLDKNYYESEAKGSNE
ncbi:oligo-beta-mannoside permease IIC protein, partial [Oceanobacillus caeni]